MTALVRVAHAAPAPIRLDLTAGLARVAVWLRVAAERRALSRLDGARLADLGLSAEAAAAEAARPFWDAPRRGA